jgi:cell fate regulator YaaT (PSP1 superfamily)
MEKTENGKVKVVGVRFRTAGKIYYFDPGDFELSRGKHVIVETARGLEYGFVVGPPMEVDEKDITQPLKAVIRISTEEDDIREKKNREREREAIHPRHQREQSHRLRAHAVGDIDLKANANCSHQKRCGREKEGVPEYFFCSFFDHVGQPLFACS